MPGDKPLFVYYCKASGKHALTTDCNLANVPRRRTDHALVLDTQAHLVKLYTTDGGTKFLRRKWVLGRGRGQGCVRTRPMQPCSWLPCHCSPPPCRITRVPRLLPLLCSPCLQKRRCGAAVPAELRQASGGLPQRSRRQVGAPPGVRGAVRAAVETRGPAAAGQGSARRASHHACAPVCCVLTCCSDMT